MSDDTFCFCTACLDRVGIGKETVRYFFYLLFLYFILLLGESILKEDPKGDLEGWLVDLRNHGASPHDAYMTLSAMASDVALLMQNLSMKSAVVLGHSMGGKVAMKLADTHPKLVAKLIVVDVAPVRTDMSKSDIPEIIDSLLAVPLPTLQSRKEVDAFLAKRIPVRTDPTSHCLCLIICYRACSFEAFCCRI